MFSGTSPYPFAKWKEKRCLIIGFLSSADGLLHPVIATYPDGEIAVTKLSEVRLDLAKLKDITKPPPGDEWKGG